MERYMMVEIMRRTTTVCQLGFSTTTLCILFIVWFNLFISTKKIFFWKKFGSDKVPKSDDPNPFFSFYFILPLLSY